MPPVAAVIQTQDLRTDATEPIYTYHLGLWFNSPQDAQKAGGPSTVTRFNGEHNAGIQVLNTQTADFPDDFGPLRHVK